MRTLINVVLFVVVLVLFGSVPASGQSLCDARFLETATAADVQGLVDQGADVNEADTGRSDQTDDQPGRMRNGVYTFT